MKSLCYLKFLEGRGTGNGNFCSPLKTVTDWVNLFREKAYRHESIGYLFGIWESPNSPQWHKPSVWYRWKWPFAREGLIVDWGLWNRQPPDLRNHSFWYWSVGCRLWWCSFFGKSRHVCRVRLLPFERRTSLFDNKFACCRCAVGFALKSRVFVVRRRIAGCRSWRPGLLWCNEPYHWKRKSHWLGKNNRVGRWCVRLRA